MVARAASVGKGWARGGQVPRTCPRLVHTFRRTALGPQDASTSSPLGGLRIAVVERWRFVALALGFAREFDAIGIVDDAVEDRVDDRRFADHPWPALYRNLGDDHDGLACVALFNDLEQVAAALADAEATGTINNTDPMPKAWMVRFGRTVGSQIRSFENTHSAHAVSCTASYPGRKPVAATRRHVPAAGRRGTAGCGGAARRRRSRRVLSKWCRCPCRRVSACSFPWNRPPSLAPAAERPAVEADDRWRVVTNDFRRVKFLCRRIAWSARGVLAAGVRVMRDHASVYPRHRTAGSRR